MFINNNTFKFKVFSSLVRSWAIVYFIHDAKQTLYNPLENTVLRTQMWKVYGWQWKKRCNNILPIQITWNFCTVWNISVAAMKNWKFLYCSSRGRFRRTRFVFFIASNRCTYHAFVFALFISTLKCSIRELSKLKITCNIFARRELFLGISFIEVFKFNKSAASNSKELTESAQI